MLSTLEKNLLSSCQPVSWVWLAWANHPELPQTQEIELLSPKTLMILLRCWQWAPTTLELCQRKVPVAQERHNENHITAKRVGVPGVFFSLNQFANLAGEFPTRKEEGSPSNVAQTYVAGGTLRVLQVTQRWTWTLTWARQSCLPLQSGLILRNRGMEELEMNANQISQYKELER